MSVHSLLVLLLLGFLRRAPPCSATSVSLVGINYGRVGNNLPSPETVPRLVSTIGVGRVRLYDADPAAIRAFANTGIELVVGLPDRCLPKLAGDAGQALAWVRSNVQAYLPAAKIAFLTVGNEVLTSNNTALPRFLLPAMENLHSALTSLGLDRQIAVTTAHSLAVLGDSYPPSTATFRRDLLPLVCPLLDFHARTGSPFFINAYPYFAYEKDPSGVALDYALLQPGAAPVVDPRSGLKYGSLLHAQIDAVYHAIAAAGATKGVEVRVSETGWPSAGDADEAGATAENAATYNRNLMKLVAEGKGTPLVPKVPLRVYMFALFNENLKPGPTSERNYGLFKADGTPAYQLGFTLDNSTATGAGAGGATGWSGDSSGQSSSGYYSISAAAATEEWVRQRRVVNAAAGMVFFCFVICGNLMVGQWVGISK
ncbi:glucan endo-1,3-beta-glucosidase 11-like [Phoenix dactylifera]|uniref:glucan endo-1,3-beta-D-glucosidase n=1 Tax=Phoenix dactylifera TaxID=42345 RepID=A0A8B9A271_PHODC|nr:glucan endo-1,3-beta-glucosidase 11-like [Phoenix dactylifera]XP_038977923.1 glucan endo-1,3-beta-glucosidase 11-like [Phoenix dactylifera]